MATAAVLSDLPPTAVEPIPLFRRQPSPASPQITNYLSSLSRPIKPNCDQNHFYLLNNYNPGYYGDGRSAYADIGNPNETVFTIPPSPFAISAMS